MLEKRLPWGSSVVVSMGAMRAGPLLTLGRRCLLAHLFLHAGANAF